MTTINNDRSSCLNIQSLTFPRCSPVTTKFSRPSFLMHAVTQEIELPLTNNYCLHYFSALLLLLL